MNELCCYNQREKNGQIKNDGLILVLNAMKIQVNNETDLLYPFIQQFSFMQ